MDGKSALLGSPFARFVLVNSVGFPSVMIGQLNGPPVFGRYEGLRVC